MPFLPPPRPINTYLICPLSQFLAITKTAWPECVRNTLSVQQCKNKVDNDIADYFSGTDKQITAQIIRPRQATDEDNYNWVVIPTYEVSGRVNGIYFNGMVFYDL